MPASSDFTAFYEKDLKDLLVPLEFQRKKLKNWVYTVLRCLGWRY